MLIGGKDEAEHDTSQIKFLERLETVGVMLHQENVTSENLQ